MSNFFKFASKHSEAGANKTGPHLRASDLLGEDVDDNANFDLSPEAEAARAEAAAVAARLEAAAAAQAAAAAAAAAFAASASSSPLSPTALPPQQPAAIVRKLVLSREPDGTNPEVTWPGTKHVDLLDNSIHYTGDAQLRERFVSRPDAWDRFPDVDKLGIAPYSYCMDLEPDAAKRDALIDEMNKHNGAPSLATAYDADTVSTAPRIWCAWPLPLAPTPTNAQLVKTTLHFQTGLPDTASVADWYAYMCGLKPCTDRVPLSLAPGAIEHAGMTRFTDATPVPVAFRDRAVHAIPVSVRISEVVNTTDLDFQVDLGVPNMAGAGTPGAPLFVSKSEPLGASSSGRPVLASSVQSGHVAMFRAAVFNSPERPRWAGVDREAEKNKFTANLDGNKAVTIKGEQVIAVRLATDTQPLNLAQYIARTYPAQLVEASVFLNKSPPRINKTAKKEGSAAAVDDPHLVGYVAVSYAALCAVLDYYCDMYAATNFGVNQHKWQLTACLSSASPLGVHALGIAAAREQAQGTAKSVRLGYKVELIQAPYEGSPLVTPEQRALLARIDAAHKVETDLACAVSFRLFKSVQQQQGAACPPGQVCLTPTFATRKTDMACLPVYTAASAATPSASPHVPIRPLTSKW